MKAIGITRKIDQLGRIVLPKELRRTMDLPTETPMEIFVDGNQIILKKYEPSCVFCGTVTIDEYKGKKVCEKCVDELKKGV